MNSPIDRSWTFDLDSAAIRSARHRVEGLLEEASFEAVAASAALVVSELTTNAILHARTPFEVRVEMLDETVRIEVHDGSTRSPAVRHFTAESTSGRGLRLVDDLCREWGYVPDPDGGGKTVWAELPLEAAPGDPMLFDLDAVEDL